MVVIAFDEEYDHNPQIRLLDRLKNSTQEECPMSDSHEIRLNTSSSSTPGKVSCCQECGEIAATKRVEFWRVIGAVFVFHFRASAGLYCKSCIHRYFWEYTLVTLCFGWWGCISFVLTPFVLLHNIFRYALCLGMPSVVKVKTPTQTVAGKTETHGASRFSGKPAVEKKVPWTARIRRFYCSLRKRWRNEKRIPCVQCNRLAFPIEGTSRYRCWNCGCRFEDPEMEL
jgi:hypothetical protein